MRVKLEIGAPKVKTLHFLMKLHYFLKMIINNYEYVTSVRANNVGLRLRFDI